MFAFRFAPLFLFATSFVFGAAVVEKRSSTTDIEAVLNTLESSTDSILPQITALKFAGTATDTTVTPLINDLTTALNTAASSLDELTPVQGFGSLKKRQSEADIVSLFAGTVTADIMRALNTLRPDASEIPDLDSFLSGVGTALNQVLPSLATVLVTLVSAVYNGIATLLNSSGLGSILGLGPGSLLL